MKATLRVYNPISEKHFFVSANLVHDCEATPKSEHVAWNGTAQIFKDSNNQYYLNFHNGNSNSQESATKISEKIAKGIIDNQIDFHEYI